jgi:hypothetical protein
LKKKKWFRKEINFNKQKRSYPIIEQLTVTVKRISNSTWIHWKSKQELPKKGNEQQSLLKENDIKPTVWRDIRSKHLKLFLAKTNNSKEINLKFQFKMKHSLIHPKMKVLLSLLWGDSEKDNFILKKNWKFWDQSKISKQQEHKYQYFQIPS